MYYLYHGALNSMNRSDNGCDRSELSTLGKALVTIDEFQIIFTAVPQMAGTRHALGFHMALQVDMLEWTGETASDVIGRPRHVEKCRDLLPTNFVVSCVFLLSFRLMTSYFTLSG